MTAKGRAVRAWGLRGLVVLLALGVLAGVAGLRQPTPASSSVLGPKTPHLAVVMLENKEYGALVGNQNAPYINSELIGRGRLFTAHYAATHPSLPDYLTLTSGGFGGCVTDGCTPGSITGDNLFSQMNAAVPAISWKVYAESMPTACWLTNSGAYLVRHNPPAYYASISAAGDGSCAQRDVPFGRLATDIAAGTLPQFLMLAPNRFSDMHDDHNLPSCATGSSLQDRICQGDGWLSQQLPVLLSDGGRNDVTVLVVVDEGTTNQGGAGHVAVIEVGPTTCVGCTESTPTTHASLFTGIERWFGLPELHPALPEL
jgi:phosphatidylinositol-3-phosphatase